MYQIGEAIPNSQIPKAPGGCDVAPAKAPAPKQQSEEERTAESLGVTVGRLRAARSYAQSLVAQARAKKEKIKMSTVRSKVLKKFNIKLV